MDITKYPSKEELYKIYILENYSSDETCQYFKLSKSTFFKIIKYYNIKKDKKLILELRENTVKQKYGVLNVSQYEDIKKLKKETTRLHYGVDNPNQSKEIRQKIQQTNISRYGSNTPAGNKEIVIKMQETCKQKYGVSNPSLVEEFKNKRKITNLKNFGVECNLSSKQQQGQIKETCILKYGVPYYCMTSDCRNKSHGSYSRVNDQVAKKLEEKKISFEREFSLENYVYDFKIGNILLEINPTYTHSIDISYHNSCEKMMPDYHFLKSTTALKHNFLCIHIFDWIDIEETLNNIIENKYSSCKVQKKDIDIHFVNLKTKECLTNVKKSEEKNLLDSNFVRVFDDGYNIILK